MTTQSFTAFRLRRGDNYDHDDARTSYRLRLAWSILATMGIEREIEHGNAVINQAAFNRHACADNCRAKPLPDWVTDEILEKAFDLADAMQTARGQFNQAAASAARSAR